ncbi:MAG: hypothetical protein PWP41_458 [Moorella sp. (in: firmicutes)]|uniref:Uncharacterized protein n=1 Tax=Neomoorella thermoacetica TaxID=1525 RepID=A0A1J5NST8_NEOTH|nr:hypothetical protein [Moorella sp. (in: firmicutes)]OIQ58855.1 hypothetical protein MOTE_16090 [Moorella thermoacetica]
MSLRYKHGGELSGSIGLLISILVRYPEVGTINYEPRDQVLRFTFMLAQPVAVEQVQEFEKKFRKSLEVYNYLEDREPQVINLHHTWNDQLMSLEVQRDVATLSRDEINLIMTLVREEFGTSLVVENSDEVQEEELIFQEELIDHMLESVKGTASERQLIAFREEGRVMVFNK